MNLVPLFELLVSLAVLVGPPVLLARVLSNSSDGPSLTDLFAIPLDPPWPRGVQEEEPARWRLERLTARREPTASKARMTRPATVARGVESCEAA